MSSSFLRSPLNHWKPDDFDVSGVRLKEPLLHITKTICLLESRCDAYAEYLQAVFRDRSEDWTSAISRWNLEECQHGVALRAVCEAGDRTFDFHRCMAHYESLVSYHAPTGESVRGSVGAELVTRCVVEALASTLYRVLADSCADLNAAAVYAALAQDEARHYGMFLKMLQAESQKSPGLGRVARCRLALRRAMELEDAQIMLASCVVAGRADSALSRWQEANWYLARVYPHYRWRHVRYAVRMLLRTIDWRATPVLVDAVTTAMWLAIRIRSLMAILGLWVAPLQASKPPSKHLVGRRGEVQRH